MEAIDDGTAVAHAMFVGDLAVLLLRQLSFEG
jgi:hypothetical protein